MKPIRIVKVLLAIILSLAGTVLPAQGQDLAQIRFVHLDPGSPALDVFVNGELAAANVSYGGSTAYMLVQTGEAELTANLATTSVQLLDETLSLAAESAAVILSSRADGRLYVAADDLSELAFGRARFSLFNAIQNEVKVALASANDDELARDGLASGVGDGPHEVDAGIYEFFLHSSEIATETESPRFKAALTAGTSHLLIIHGSLDDPHLLSVSSATEGGVDSGRIRYVHAVAGAAPLDVRINDQLILPALAFAAPSQHIALPSGSQRIALFLGPAEIMSEQLNIRAGQMSTLAIMGSNADLKMRSFSDSSEGVDESSAVVSLLNAIPGSVISHLQLEGGAIAAFNVPFGEAGDAAKIVPGTQSMTMHLDIGDDRGAVDVPARHFAGGSYYNLIAVAGGAFSAPRLLIAETSLQRQVRAAAPMIAAGEAEEHARLEPIAEEQALAVAEEESALETEAAQLEEAITFVSSAEEQVGESPETESSTESEAMPAEDDEPAETEAAPEEASATAATNVVVAGSEISSVTPYAFVVVDPDSALHVRQYPSSDAMSLGLLPAASDLLILGRRAPADLDSAGLRLLPVDLSDFTADPAAALRPFQDLAAADTWLFVVYVTPDGGALYGWVNALYLQVFDHKGERQRLASLAPIAQNQLGGATNTDIRPPSLADHISARVSGLDPDAFLNLRAGNDASTEVLTQVSADSALGFIGLDAAEEWAFVRYESPQGNMVTGWASTVFIQLLLNGKPALAESLRALDPSAVRVIGDGVTGVIQPAAPNESDQSDQPLSGIVGEVNVNSDSALHLRRYPDGTSESLALIPRGMQLYLDGVTDSSGWYKITYEGDDGWVAGDYLILSMNGRQYARAFLDGHLPRFTDQGF